MLAADDRFGERGEFRGGARCKGPIVDPRMRGMTTSE